MSPNNPVRSTPLLIHTAHIHTDWYLSIYSLNSRRRRSTHATIRTIGYRFFSATRQSQTSYFALRVAPWRIHFAYPVTYAWLCRNDVIYKPEVHNASQRRQRGPSHDTGNMHRSLVKFGCVVFEICWWTVRHTDKHTNIGVFRTVTGVTYNVPLKGRLHCVRIRASCERLFIGAWILILNTSNSFIFEEIRVF